MKIIYVCFNDFDNLKDVGINKKVKSQINALKKYDEEIKYVYLKNNKLFIFDKDKEKCISKIYRNKIDQKVNRYIDVVKFLNINDYKFDLIYIRHCGFDMCFQNFLRSLSYISANIYLEIPTYPYDKEWKKINPQNILDKIYRNLSKKYVNKIVTFSDDKKIFGIDTINIDNGVDVSLLPMKTYGSDDGIIKLLCVSSLSFWHGYDRIIEGLNNYYQSYRDIKVEFHVVGLGEELENLKNMVIKYGLTDKVFFYGSKDGKELNDIFNECNIAIGSLGIHRIGLDFVSPLKTREYCARAIPFVYSYNDKAFSGEEEFLLCIDADDTPVNITSIIAFYKEIQAKTYIKSEMRKYSVEKFDWNIQINKIIEQYKGASYES